ncbi:TolC family protein [Sphingomonas changnyeongensis]|uniref:TolC family protein n=1 Tax=Sphingomonas changnyeongensis TaxID=2698679 RepID=A0A7Z2NVB7_9SPHN|nr:TolC family protein [Sphingomonas changnyeongensis]QHL90488.1 TolC family protein [Sphingomonas changnyeongensis]
MDVEARLPLFDGFRTPNAVRQAQAELESGRAALEATVQQVLLDLLTAAADAHRDRRIRAFAEEQARAVADRLQSTSRLLELREATVTDQSQAQARLAVSEANVLAVEEAVAASAAAFAAVAGRPALVVPALPDLPPIPPNLDEARQLAESSPVVRAARGTAAAAQKAVDVARGAFAPQVDLVGGYEFLTGGVANLFIGRLPNDRSAVYGGVELRVPLFQQGREYAELARARAVRAQRQQQIAASLRETVRDVETAWARWTAATGTIAAAHRAVLAQEQAAQGVRREAVGGGSRTLIDVLDADNELLAARAAMERAVRNEYVARATVLAATGRLALKRPAGGSARLDTVPAAPIRGQSSN